MEEKSDIAIVIVLKEMPGEFRWEKMNERKIYAHPECEALYFVNFHGTLA